MNFRPKMQVIAKEDYERVHEASLKILEETGVAFHSQEALDIFEKHGAKVSDKRVFIPREMVEKALKTVPQKFNWRARNNEQSIVLGEGYAVEPNVGCVYVQDLDNGRRLGTLKDYANIQKLHQSSTISKIVGATPVDPSDVPGDQKYLYMLYETIKNTDKPIISSCVAGKKNLNSLKMVEMAMGKEGIFEDNTCVAVSVNPLSPLAFGDDVTETLIEYAKQKQAVMVLPCIMAGVTGPITLFGTVVLQNTEILAGIILTQLINPGNPVVACPCSSAAYMKKATYITGTPEMMLIDVAGLQMFLDYYNIPTRIMTGMSDSKTVDVQAGYETMQNLMMGILSGAHILHECSGVLDSIMTLSYEKFIIDEELISRVFRIADGLDTSDEAMALDVIQEVGKTGSYMTHPHTFARFRDLWLPTVSDWEPYDDWIKDEESVVERANKIFKERLNNAPETMIDSELDKDLMSFIKSVSKDLSA